MRWATGGQRTLVVQAVGFRHTQPYWRFGTAGTPDHGASTERNESRGRECDQTIWSTRDDARRGLAGGHCSPNCYHDKQRHSPRTWHSVHTTRNNDSMSTLQHFQTYRIGRRGCSRSGGYPLDTFPHLGSSTASLETELPRPTDKCSRCPCLGPHIPTLPPLADAYQPIRRNPWPAASPHS